MKMLNKIASSSILSVTLHSSIFVQIITGIIGIFVLINTAFPISPLDDVWQMLFVEMTVQAIEFCFYIIWIRNAHSSDMARVRYFDWFLTTPMMLFTLAAYMTYAADKYRNSTIDTVDSSQTIRPTLDENKGLFGFLKSESKYLISIAVANFCMLIIGFAADVGYVSNIIAFIVGFLSMGVSFGILWQRYARHSQEGKILFLVVSIVWSIYGIAFMADPITKNSIYNGLDVISKNLFGLFLAYKLMSASNKM
jgi:bacteriorhodopsin